MKPKPNVSNFRELVRWVADNHHEGVVDSISSRVGVSGALADRWVKGKVRNPSIASLQKFCKAYDLDLRWVLKIVLHEVPSKATRPKQKQEPLYY